ncbi:MAG: K(+)-transporting ATPase subunit C [Clostridium sp.]
MNTLKKSILITISLLVICGIIYPLAVTGISQVIFPNKANGSLININGKDIGSEVVGQLFTDKRFFKGRVSAVNYNTYTNKDDNYTGAGSGSQNLAPTNPELIKRIEKDKEKLLKENPGVLGSDIPTDILTSSGSGLDPDISPKSAEIQIPRISKETGLSQSKLKEIVNKNTSNKVFGVFGENKVNVLKTNIDVAKAIGII